MRDAKASEENWRVKNPVSPSTTTSGIPPAGKAITGTPAENASTMTRAMPSRLDGTTNRSNSRRTGPTSCRHPKNSTGKPPVRWRTASK